MTKITRTELINEIQRLADELGHPPSTTEMKTHGQYSEVTYYNHFGSWGDALEAAGFDRDASRGTITDEELISDLERVAADEDGYVSMNTYDEHGTYSAETFTRRFGSWGDALETAGLPAEPRRDRDTQISDDELLDELQRLADELGKTPTFAEMQASGA